MPAFDLRGIHIAEYQNTSGVVGYTNPMKVGDAMNVNLELRYAEGRLYAESSLAEYMKLATGGAISIGVKYIPEAAQKVMYGATEKTRTVGEKTVKGLSHGAKDQAKYVGVAFYAPAMRDGVNKYMCMFVSRALFGPPSYVYQTRGESITFQTPTTTGEFLPDNSANQQLIETAIADDEATAIAWCAAVLGSTSAANTEA